MFEKIRVSLHHDTVIMGIESAGEYNDLLFLIVMIDTDGGKLIDWEIFGFTPGQFVRNVGDYIGSCMFKGMPHSFFTGPGNSCNRPPNDAYHYITKG